MRRLIFRPLVLMLTFLVGLFVTFLFTFAVDAWTRLFDDPAAENIPALCRSEAIDGPNACAQPTAREIEEYAIYSMLLKAMYQGGHSSMAFIMDRTSVDNLECKAIASPLEELRQRIPLMKQETLDSFREANRQSYPFDNRLRLPGHITWIAAEDIKSYFVEGGGGWQAFKRDYEGVPGFFTFSKVGFNRDMNQALLYFTSTWGEKCGITSIVFLVKEDGAWRIKGSIESSISSNG